MKKVYEVIGASFGLGSHSPMTANAPQVLRRAGLITRLDSITKVVDGGNISIEPTYDLGNPKIKYLKDVAKFADRYSIRILESLLSENIPVTIGGDHTVSIGSIAACKKYLGDDELGLIWIDAHPDINTEDTTPSGNIHGMGVAVSLGLGNHSLVNLLDINPKVKPENIVYLGLRDVDTGERELIRKLGIKAYSMSEIDSQGIGKIVDTAFGELSKRVGGILASFDLDVCDPSIAPGVGTPVRGGLSFRESHYVMEGLAKLENLLSIELVELNPGLDSSGSTCELGISLLESAIGKTIL